MRQMRFKAIALIEISAAFVGLLVACGLAASGFGYWSLVAMHLAIFATTLVMTWLLSGWRPSPPRRGSGVRPMLLFGAHLSVSSVMGRLAVGSDEILIGRFSGAEALGFYTRAAALSFRPLEQLLSPSGSIVIPVLSRMQSDSVRYRRTFIHIQQAIAILCFLLMAPLTALAEPIIQITDCVMRTLECAEPELAADVVENGIYLAGGGALLRGMDRKLTESTGLEVTLVDDPLSCVARGTSVYLDNLSAWKETLESDVDDY